ncbi:hypothetical protein BCSJ1_26258, partial [Bacillus cereus SJ1]
VRLLDHLFVIAQGYRQIGDADADGEGDGRPQHVEPHGLDRLAQALGEQPGAFHRRVQQHHAEFLAAVASGDVGIAHMGLDHPGEGLDRLIAHGVTIGVVDALEMIDVEHHQRQATAIALVPGEFLGEALFPVTAVGQSGQAVGTRQFLQLV